MQQPQPQFTTTTTNANLLKPCTKTPKPLLQYSRKKPTQFQTISNQPISHPKNLLFYYRKRKRKDKDQNFGGGLRLGEVVEVFYEGMWRKGRVLGVLSEGLRYLVSLMVGPLDESGGNVEEVTVTVQVFGSHVSVVRVSHDGSWALDPLHLNVESKSLQTELNGDRGHLETEQELNSDSNSELTTVAEIRASPTLRVRCAEKRRDGKFYPGTTIEVRSHADGLKGSWYAATIVGSAGVGKFAVEYHTLRTEDETKPLKEVVNEQDIRPSPPEIPRNCRFKVLEEVDAWDNDGWWEGVISDVLDDWKYIVFFALTKEKILFHHSNLRHHQTWFGGEWLLTSQITEDQSAEESLTENFREGMLVEVRSDEDGYRGSWYTATIIGLTVKDKLLVEYDSLKTNDNKQPLREEVSADDVRPSPPVVRVGCYKLLQEVDAWNDGGWWGGVISKILQQRKYIVSLTSSSEKMEVDHICLRPHQEWIDGKWTLYKQKKRPSSEMKHNRSECDGTFKNGAKVEVRSYEPGYEGSWYSAVIVRPKKRSSFIIQYMTLLTEDETDYLREEIDAKNIRPCPPPEEEHGQRDRHDIVDAWYHDGWWVGVISEVLASGRYAVYFKSTGEEIVFDHHDLRTHLEWIDGKWTAAIQVVSLT